MVCRRRFVVRLHAVVVGVPAVAVVRRVCAGVLGGAAACRRADHGGRQRAPQGEHEREQHDKPQTKQMHGTPTEDAMPAILGLSIVARSTPAGAQGPPRHSPRACAPGSMGWAGLSYPAPARLTRAQTSASDADARNSAMARRGT